MSHRVGICSSCEANYKVPADFAADKAKCKSCGGVVEIGGVVDDPPPPPVPAKPVRKAEPKIEEHVPSGKTGEGPSMMERLKAKRKAELEQAEASAKPAAQKAAAPQKTPVKKAAAKEHETISSIGAPKARATSRKTAPSRSTRPSRSRRGRGKDDEDEGDEEEGGRKTRRQKKKSPVPLICTLVLIVGGGIVGGYFWLKGAAEEAMELIEEEVAKAEKVIEADITTPPEGTSDEEAGDEPEETAKEAPAEEEKPKPVADRKRKDKDPMEIDLSGLADFGPASGCDAARWEILQEDAATLVDPLAGAAGGRAGKRLQEAGILAIPAIINVFKTLDLGSDGGMRDGDVIQRTLEKIYNGKNFAWKYSTEPNDHWYNRRVVELWWKNWDNYKGDEAGWLRFTGLDKEGVKPSSGGGADDLSTDELDALDDI